jgi:hypothetical protein
MRSVKEGKRRVPTRFTIAAADCLLTITNILAADPPVQPDISEAQISSQNEQKKSLITPLDSTTDHGRNDWLGVDCDADDGPSTSGSDLFNNFEMRELAIWEHLDNLISLLRELKEVSESCLDS